MTTEEPQPQEATPLPSETARGRRLKRLRRTLTGLALLSALGAYTASCALVPLPDLQPEFALAASEEFSADPALAEEAVAAQSGPTALGWAHSEEVWANDDRTMPIASLTKLATVLICLEQAPADENGGPEYTVGPEHAEIIDRVLTQDGVVIDAPEGLTLDTRQLLEVILLPSANNYAIAYAEWVFGSQKAFVEAAAEWTERNGLSTLSIAEPSGLSPRNEASAADVVRLGRLALDHPLVAEVVAEPWADIPGIGPIENSNPLIGEQGVIGLKTGTLAAAGYNLAAARSENIDGRELVSISAVLDRSDDEERADAARAALDAARDTVETIEVIAEEEQVGSVTAWDGSTVPLLAGGGISEVLAPGETAQREIRLGRMEASPAGTTTGVVDIEAPSGKDRVPVVTASAIEEPDLWWRLTHPAIVFGWQDPAPID